MTSKTNIEKINKIKSLKQKKNAVILVHAYQNIELDDVADYVGDSLYLSKMAATTDADIIVFAGVYFMAETAKILSPRKKVLLPKLEAGCKMADMITPEKLILFKKEYPGVPVVCYINSSAAVKALSDICCTSANAVEVVRSLNSEKVLFIPDQHLGKFVEKKLTGVEVITYSGFCPTHMIIDADEIKILKSKYPEALVLAHPECKKSVSEIADFTGSTTAIMKYVKNSSDNTFIIATENAVAERLQRDYPDKKFVYASNKALCKTMKCNTLDDIENALLNEVHSINISDDIIQKALLPIEKMMLVKK